MVQYTFLNSDSFLEETGREEVFQLKYKLSAKDIEEQGEQDFHLEYVDLDNLLVGELKRIDTILYYRETENSLEDLGLVYCRPTGGYYQSGEPIESLEELLVQKLVTLNFKPCID